MNIALWVLQGLLALAFGAHGLFLLFPTASALAQMNAMMPTWFRLFLGVAEVLAAIGLTLPGITGIQPWWVPRAAGGIMIVMVSAAILHATRGEVSGVVVTTILLAMATCVAYMRWKVLPIPSRGTTGVAGGRRAVS
jgi:hypothetical protein